MLLTELFPALTTQDNKSRSKKSRSHKSRSRSRSHKKKC